MSKNSNQQDDYLNRRPNPKDWTQPKAPYNPYDPNDIRPSQGYPSEFKLPGQSPSGFSSLPRQPTQYQQVNETMERLNYIARPKSDIYPNQYKILRKVDTNKRLDLGSRYFSTLLTSGLVIYFTFFYRWNDGKENVFSDFRRFQLKLKEKIKGGLNEQDYDDLYHPKSAGIVLKNVKDSQYISEDIRRNKEHEDLILNRPSERHILEAERIKQEQEEKMLRDLDLYKQYGNELRDELDNNDISKKKKWFGIF
ncbi:unnamed protein product [Candida verbasci]|uniref:Uncharacterized protein n=1 Tax=Candida verbasci TaxID=1227364 RepID=A0A9W4X9J3_9ASCO|nr:unnamed protein product [Candida verbasci]